MLCVCLTFVLYEKITGFIWSHEVCHSGIHFCLGYWFVGGHQQVLTNNYRFSLLCWISSLCWRDTSVCDWTVPVGNWLLCTVAIRDHSLTRVRPFRVYFCHNRRGTKFNRTGYSNDPSWHQLLTGLDIGDQTVKHQGVTVSILPNLGLLLQSIGPACLYFIITCIAIF